MGYQVLARKWRPKRFQEVIGQDHIVRSLTNVLRSKKIGHAYLMVGTRGVGKTTLARIFARAIRCEDLSEDANPCGRCPSCGEKLNDFNIIEIDGASNNSVDEIRGLIGNVRYLPTRGLFKVYIVDEVHMLSKSAFNAFLKTLEEPPSHIVFIFATTDPEKLLRTVLSRCQRFDFREVAFDVLCQHIGMIATHENITFPEESLIREIARIGDGSVRDALSALDQVLSYCTDGVVTEEILTASLGIARRSKVRELLDNILLGNAKVVSSLYREMTAQNIPLKNVAHSLLDVLFHMIESWDTEKTVSHQLKEGISESELYWIYQEMVRDLDWGLTSLMPCQVVEIALRKITKRRDFTTHIPAEGEQEGQGHKTWESFLDFVGKLSPGMKVNLERGNLLSSPTIEAHGIGIELAFATRAKIFREHLEEERDNLVNYLARFYGVEKQKIFLSLIVLGDGEAKEKNFKSKEQIQSEENKRVIDQKKLSISSDPLIQRAEEMFQTKVDSIVIGQ